MKRFIWICDACGRTYDNDNPCRLRDDGLKGKCGFYYLQGFGPLDRHFCKGKLVKFVREDTWGFEVAKNAGEPHPRCGYGEEAFAITTAFGSFLLPQVIVDHEKWRQSQMDKEKPACYILLHPNGEIVRELEDGIPFWTSNLTRALTFSSLQVAKAAASLVPEAALVSLPFIPKVGAADLVVKKEKDTLDVPYPAGSVSWTTSPVGRKVYLNTSSVPVGDVVAMRESDQGVFLTVKGTPRCLAALRNAMKRASPGEKVVSLGGEEKELEMLSTRRCDYVGVVCGNCGTEIRKRVTEDGEKITQRYSKGHDLREQECCAVCESMNRGGYSHSWSCEYFPKTEGIPKPYDRSCNFFAFRQSDVPDEKAFQPEKEVTL